MNRLTRYIRLANKKSKLIAIAVAILALWCVIFVAAGFFRIYIGGGELLFVQKQAWSLNDIVAHIDDVMIYPKIIDVENRPFVTNQSSCSICYEHNSAPILSAIALFLNTVGFLIVIYQTYLSRKSLDAAKQGITDAKTVRQLEALPKHGWIIQVICEFERWENDLHNKSREMRSAIRYKNEETLRQLSATKIRVPHDLHMDRFSMENMPPWLGEIWISGANYYYEANCSLSGLYSEKHGGADFEHAKTIIEIFDKHTTALKNMRGYINDMVPHEILHAPDSLSEEDFLI